ncbi:MAG: hypothetical protein J0M15_13005 [Deltaproteobacteria bacterium]|nr:hypothetical protein [Deltaproteobacteria bacterium]
MRLCLILLIGFIFPASIAYGIDKPIISVSEAHKISKLNQEKLNLCVNFIKKLKKDYSNGPILIQRFFKINPLPKAIEDTLTSLLWRDNGDFYLALEIRNLDKEVLNLKKLNPNCTYLENNDEKSLVLVNDDKYLLKSSQNRKNRFCVKQSDCSDEIHFLKNNQIVFNKAFQQELSSNKSKIKIKPRYDLPPPPPIFDSSEYIFCKNNQCAYREKTIKIRTQPAPVGFLLSGEDSKMVEEVIPDHSEDDLVPEKEIIQDPNSGSRIIRTSVYFCFKLKTKIKDANDFLKKFNARIASSIKGNSCGSLSIQDPQTLENYYKKIEIMKKNTVIDIILQDSIPSTEFDPNL